MRDADDVRGEDAGVVRENLRQAVEHPVAVERGIVVGGGVDALPLVRLPIDDDTAHYRWQPRLGEHTGEILREAGFTRDEVGRLM